MNVNMLHINFQPKQLWIADEKLKCLIHGLELRRGFFLSFFPSDTPHYENVLPDGWCLTDIGELLINRDGERKPVSSVIRSKQTSKIYDYYGAAGVIDKVDSYLFDERLLLIGEDGANLLSRSKNNAFFAEGRYWVNNHAHVLDATDKNLLDFIAIVINSMKLDDYITGSAQPKLSQDNLNKIPIVLPPLAEQQRIIAEIKKWFTLIDRFCVAEILGDTGINGLNYGLSTFIMV